jgi:hypothetical protein
MEDFSMIQDDMIFISLPVTWNYDTFPLEKNYEQ